MTVLMQLLCARWDSERKRSSYKVQPAGTSRFALLNEHELRLLRDQIDRALEGTDAADRRG